MQIEPPTDRQADPRLAVRTSLPAEPAVTARSTACDHCGLPVPRARRTDAGEQYCCAGCEAVADLLRDESLTRFYDLGGGEGVPVGAVPQPKARHWLPELEAQSLLVEGADGAPLVQLRLDVQGIRCAACVWVIQELWRRQPHGMKIDVNPSLGQMTLVYERGPNPPTPDRDQIAPDAGSEPGIAAEATPIVGRFFDEIERLGYRVAPARKRERADDRSLLIRLGTCAALAMNAMLFAISGYFGLDEEGGPLKELFDWLSLAIATATVVVGGPVFFQAAWGGLKARVLHLDLPISVGIALAYSSSVVSFFRGDGASYFDTVTVFVALMLAGRFLQQRAIARNRDLLLQNDGGDSLRSRIVRGDSLEFVPVTSIEPGEIVLLAAGELLPVEAELLDSSASFSLDWINGESAPRRFVQGVKVPAGAFHCGNQPVRLVATASAEDSGLMRLLRDPDLGGRDLQAGSGTAPSIGFWARVSKIYVGLVLLVAALGAGLWWVLDPALALPVATSILVVTCPCALGIATPLGFDLALAWLRRRGVYVRAADLLDKARRVRRIAFDKTGTLTWGGLHAAPIRECSGELWPVLFTVASSSNHPVARAVAAAVPRDGRRFLAAVSVEEIPGQGLLAVYDGVEFRLGSVAFALDDESALGASGGEMTLCAFGREGHVVGCFEIDEDYRHGFRSELDALRGQGYELVMLSGDRSERVQRAAARLGFGPHAAHGGLSPEQKAEYLRSVDDQDTLMIGDGLNDALAFDAAYCAGTPAMDQPVMPARSDFCVIGGGADAVRSVLEVSQQFFAVTRLNLWLAGIYNAVAVGLCFAGMMTPVLCAILMPLSSLLLIAHTVTRLRGGIGSSAEGSGGA